MKKMNNKGFAISTLLYGLVLVAFLVVTLLVSIMATNRSNTSTLVDKIEDELNRYSETAAEITKTTDAQEYIVPYGQAGWYKIELWSSQSSETSENGSYTSGLIYLEENEHLYFYIGTSTSPNTDARLVSGAKEDAASLNSRIMIASADGSSYISGYAGSNSVAGENNPTLTYQTKHYSGKYFINGIVISGTNTGEGKAKIQLVVKEDDNTPNEEADIPLKNTDITNGVRYIRDCIDIPTTETNSTYEYWQEIQVIQNGVNIAKDKTIMYNGVENTNLSKVVDGDVSKITGTITNTPAKCITIDLQDIYYNIEEIAIYHYTESGNGTFRESITVSNDNSTYSIVKSWGNGTYKVTENTEGIRISSRQIEKSTSIPTGNYYIMPLTSTNMVLTRAGEGISSTLFNGAKLQKWTIENVRENYYKITEAEDAYAMQVLGGVEAGATVGTLDKYKGHDWELWKIEPLNNGYYTLKPISDTNNCLGTPDENRTIISACYISLYQYNQFKFITADY